MKRERQSHIFDREQHDHYVEERWVSERLFQAENFGPKGSRILDPFCGWGRFPIAAFNAGYRTMGSDIIDRDGRYAACEYQRADFFDQSGPEPWWRSCDSIAGNPPFKNFKACAVRALDVAKYKVALVWLVRCLPAASWLINTPLSHIWFLTPRPSMPTGDHIARGGEVGSGQQDFCALVWRHGYVGEPTMGWLHRDGGHPNDDRRKS